MAQFSGRHGSATALEQRILLLEKELAGLQQKVADLCSIERYRDVMAQRHQGLEPVTLSRMAAIEARDFLEAGTGFHFLEYGSRGVAYRWIGPGPTASVTFWVDRSGPSEIRVHVQSFGVSSPQAPVTIMVDGVPHGARLDEGGVVLLVGPVPPREVPGPTEVTIVAPAMFSPAEAGEGGDARELGMAISRIEISAI